MGDSIFEKGVVLDVTQHIEKKGRFSYLSWAWAVQELRKLDHGAKWEIKHFTTDGFNQVPYMDTNAGCFVEVIVTLSNGTSFPQIHPVLDNANKPIEKPNSFQINTSIQRCLTKAIALASGIGLHLYAGEDLLPSGGVDITEEQLDILNKYIEKTGANLANFLKYMKVEELSKIKACDYNRGLKVLKQKERAVKGGKK